MSVKRFFTDSFPKHIFIDTNFLVYVHYEYPIPYTPLQRITQKQSKIAKEFLKRLFSEGIKISISSMVFPEFWKSILINKIVDEKVSHIKEEKRVEEAEKYLSRNPLCIKEYFKDVKESTQKLAELLESSEGEKIKVIETNKRVSEKSMEVMEEYCLDSYDAIHIGTMVACGINDFATGDGRIINHCGKKLNIWTYPVGSLLSYTYEKLLKEEEGQGQKQD